MHIEYHFVTQKGKLKKVLGMKKADLVVSNGHDYEKELSRIFDQFNSHFWNNELPSSDKIIITFSPTKYALGHLTQAKVWRNTSGNDGKYELNISAYSIGRDIYEVCGTLLHEQVHLYCNINNIHDTSNQGHYHNKSFKKAAENHGLICMKYGNYGYCQTELTEESKKYVDTLNIKRFEYQRNKSNTAQNNLIKYSCPLCQFPKVYVSNNRGINETIFVKCGICNTFLEPYSKGVTFKSMNKLNSIPFKNRIFIVTDGGLDDAIALQYFFTHPKIIQYLQDDKNAVDIRCVSGCVQAYQTYKNTQNLLATVKPENFPHNNIFVTCVPAPYDQAVVPWDGYGIDGVLGLFDETTSIFPSINSNERVSGENMQMLLLSPFTHAYKLLKTYKNPFTLVTAMGGNDIETETEGEEEFNKSFDRYAYNETINICKRNNIHFSPVTMEACQRSDKLLIDVPDYLEPFYKEYQRYCDAYTNQMKKLNLNTACYDLVAAVDYINKLW